MPQNQADLFHSFIAALGVLTVLLCIFSFSIFYHLRNKQRQLRSKSFQDESRVEFEKARIAADLHDDFGSLITGLQLSFSSLAERHVDDPLYSSTAHQLSVSLDRLRHISLNLVPRELEREGLLVAIESMVERINLSGRILVSLYSAIDLHFIQKEKAMLLFRVVQEILSNAIRHSNASQIEIGFAKSGNHLILEIRDNGRGFDYAICLGKKESSGLKNIQSRLELLQAVHFVESALGKGTHYFIRIAFKKLSDEG